MADLEDDLEHLIQMNRALQAENNALREDAGEDDIATWLEMRLEALRRERDALQSVLHIGEELKVLQRTNMIFHEVARQLSEDNSLLCKETSTLQSQHSGPGLQPNGISAAAQRTAEWQARASPAQEAVEGRIRHLCAAMNNGRQDVLDTCTKEQRKDLVASMLKNGLLDPEAGAVAGEENAPQPNYGMAQVRNLECGSRQAAAMQPGRIVSSSVVTAGPKAVIPRTGSADQRVRAITEALGRGDTSVLGSYSSVERKELISNMLKAALSAPADQLGPDLDGLWSVASKTEKNQPEPNCRVDMQVVSGQHERGLVQRADADQRPEVDTSTATGCKPPGQSVTFSANVDSVDVEWREDSRYARELAVREMLQRVHEGNR